MDLVPTVLSVVAPVFLLAAVGFVWVKAGLEYRVEFVTRLAMTMSVPCLIFVALMKTVVAPAAIGIIAVASAVVYLVLTAVFWAAVRLAGLDRRTYLAPLIFGNTGNLGLPLALFAFGQEGLGLVVVVFAVMAVMSFTFGIWMVAGGGSPFRVLKEPMVGATLLGALFLWRGWHTPEWITNTLQLAGQMAIPLMLITLGVAVARLHPRGVVQATVLNVLKAALCTAAARGIGRWFALPDPAFAVLVLQVATPVAVTSYLIAEKYRADAESVAGLVVMSTLFSVLTLPLTLAFLL
ncbi:MAG: AEC family transporter [Paracoccaceae bacterium]